MNAVARRSREKRWLIVSEDGRHATLGRHTDPTDEQIQRCGAQLDRQGLAGWLVVSEGAYYSNSPVTLLMVRPITTKAGDWNTAERQWHDLRERANS